MFLTHVDHAISTYALAALCWNLIALIWGWFIVLDYFLSLNIKFIGLLFIANAEMLIFLWV